jgi:dTDP-4-dehydrorhamnose 3,5-epimerase-like enzyme
LLLETLEDRNLPAAMPVAFAASAIAEAHPIQINVLANDPEPSGVTLAPGSVRISPPSHGSATVNRSTGVITYTPAANFVGAVEFYYSVADTQGVRSNAALVGVVVEKPVAADDWSDTDGTTPVAISVLDNDTAPPGGSTLLPSSVVIVTKPAHGHVVVNADGTITYTANATFMGTDVFRYRVSDSAGGVSAPASVYVRVNRPDAADEWTDTDGTTPVSIDVLANATDPDGNGHLVASSVVIVSQPAHGHAVANPDGTITYTAAGNFTGTDSFKYTIADDNGGVSLPATAYVRVNRPTAGNVLAVTTGAAPVIIDVLAQSTDPDGNQHLVPDSLVIVTEPAHGTVVANDDGTFTYTADAGFSGSDSFHYTITDDNGGTSLPGTVTVITQSPAANHSANAPRASAS